MKTTWVGDRALLRRVPGDLAAANRSAIRLAESVRARSFQEVSDVVIGARSVMVVLAPGVEPGESLLDALSDEPDAAPARAPAQHSIQVRYGGDDGPDLDEVARAHGLDPSEVTQMHSSATYTVAFIGFAPGFPYLLGLEPMLATPRLESPRVRVEAGSVGIGGSWTGIYPSAMPGGWRIIGRTDTPVVDHDRSPPALLAPGDTVRFVPV